MPNPKPLVAYIETLNAYERQIALEVVKRLEECGYAIPTAKYVKDRLVERKQSQNKGGRNDPARVIHPGTSPKEENLT